MTIVRPFLFLAAGFATLFLLAESLGLMHVVDDMFSAPKTMVAFVAFCVAIVAMLSKLSNRVP